MVKDEVVDTEAPLRITLRRENRVEKEKKRLKTEVLSCSCQLFLSTYFFRLLNCRISFYYKLISDLILTENVTASMCSS